jgi:hypothetical protein
VELLTVLERYRSFFLTVAIVGTIGVLVPGMLDMLERSPGAVEASSAPGRARQPRVGDCVVDPGLGRFTRSLASCDDADALEVFHTFEVVADDYPGEFDVWCCV